MHQRFFLIGRVYSIELRLVRRNNSTRSQKVAWGMKRNRSFDFLQLDIALDHKE